MYTKLISFSSDMEQSSLAFWYVKKLSARAVDGGPPVSFLRKERERDDQRIKKNTGHLSELYTLI